jgi:hypothetical protein
MVSSPYEASVDDEINEVSMGRPHVVLLGAGASRAAFMNGDRNGRVLPLIFASSPLLYPIARKNYEQHPMIASAWDYLRKSLKEAFMFTVFGYGAPDSDAGAIALLHGAWGSTQDRALEQTELIDTRPEDALVKTWESFIHTHHYEIHSNFYESWISKHPRRSGEAYWNQYMEAKFISNNPIPQNAGFAELWDWYRPLLEVEAAIRS